MEEPTRSIEAENLTAFKTALYKRYLHAPHLEVLDRELMAVTQFIETGGTEGTWLLIVEMPPRHGKTLTVSRYYPAWHLGRNPDNRLMLVSYGASLAEKNSRYARGIITNERYQAIFPGIELDKASKAVDAWDISGEEGGADALGVLGGATGKGSHLSIWDDLLKGRQAAESEPIRNHVWDAVIDDLMSRSEPGGAIVLNGTRWHEDDPIGRMLQLVEDPAKVNGPVRHIRLCALPEVEEDYACDARAGLVRDPSGALFPARYPRRILEAIRERSGPYSWASLYQQRPAPAEGGLFKRGKFNRIMAINPNEIERTVRFWDLAMSEKTSADYTVGVKMAKTKTGRYIVVDVVRRQIEWDDVPGLMADIAVRDGSQCVIGFEKKGYMSRAGKMLMRDQRLDRHSVFGYPKETDKYTNALPFAARVGEDLVDVLNATWTDTFIDELCAFNHGAHDDQVDAAAGAYFMLTQNVALPVSTSTWA